MIIEFGEHLPDEAALGSPGTTLAKNVRPHKRGFLSLPAFTIFSDAIDARPQGAISMKDKDQASYDYVGNASKIYSLVQGSWTDVSLAGGYSTSSTESWEFVRWGNKVLAVNFTDDPQQLTLGGANFSDLTTDLKARHINAVRDFVVMGNTTDGVDGNKPNRVRWSAINDETDWTVSATTQSDYQDIESWTGGVVQKVLGGEYGTIIMDRSIGRMDYVGSPTIFEFDETLPGYGTSAPNSVVQNGDIFYMLGNDGFYAVANATNPIPIGANKINDTFFADFQSEYPERVIGSIDRANKFVYWIYPGSGATGGRPNHILIYDWISNKWSYAEDELEWVFDSLSTGETSDSTYSQATNCDDVDEPCDSPTWAGGTVQIGAFNEDFKLGFFSGTAMSSVIETGETQLTPERKTQTNGVRPLIDGGTATVQAGIRNRQSDSVTWKAAQSQNAQGRASVRSNARYHRFRLNTTGNFDFAIGVDVEGRPRGQR